MEMKLKIEDETQEKLFEVYNYTSTGLNPLSL